MSIYKAYTNEQLENLFSNFLIDRWSYSSVTTFARNEKAFEMQYVYNEKARTSATTVAGQAYHESLQYYFEQLRDGNRPDVTTLEKIAFEYIDEFKANWWKLQKTTPTIEECKIKATQTVSSLIRNFLAEVDTYESEIDQILDVEIKAVEFLTINGVDIPLPCHCKIDLVVQLKSGEIAIIDHKSKASFTNEEEMAMSIGTQAITYINAYESKTGIGVDQVWFVENKYSKNRDGSPQLNAFRLSVDADTRKLYEAMLYEPLKRVLEATNNPDYVYVINEADAYVDRAELYDFWTKTMVCEIEDFNVPEAKKELLSKRLKKIRDVQIATVNPSVIKNFRKEAAKFIQYDLSNKDMTPSEKIEHVLRSFGIIVKVAEMFDGYSSNTYLLETSSGVKITSIHSRKLDIANALDVPNVRISKELVMHGGKSYIAVEFAKKRDRILNFDKADLKDQKIPIGKDNFGNVIYWDLNNQSTPHKLVCGATGSGKSVSLRSTIEYAKMAGVKDIYILDPKFEFSQYQSDKSVKVVQDIEEIEETMRLLVDDMQERVKSGKSWKTLIIFDEFADAVANAKSGKELDVWEMQEAGFFKQSTEQMLMGLPPQPKMKNVKVGTLKSLEENLKILLQKGRSAGFRIIAATQRASVQVITGDAKVNFPVQICFRVPKETDSRVVIDEAGAESLGGMGDGLIKSPEYNNVVRFQAYYTA